VFHVLFYQPEIPPNTGNAIRLAAATGCHLHLVRPLGFDLSDARLRRAGLDYHDLASVTVYDDLPAAWDALGGSRVMAFTSRGSTRYTDIRYRPGDVLMFGRESTGLPADVLADPHVTATVRLPMRTGLRSLNLSNTAAVAVYEALRQHDFDPAR
jgi:tRNA (cytidine/uridine-2'-O-)-methyltransferase